jgi:DNA-directed RNA polymerase specialized sigma24 family protein
MARYRDAFGRYALHMLGNREEAQEALQDSFEVAEIVVE